MLLSLLNNSSRAIERFTRRKFYPRVETRFYDHPRNSQELRLDDDMLALTTLKTQNGACTVASSVMYLATGREWNRPPYDKIILSDNSGCTLNYSGTPQRANELTATWGYHEDYGNAWVDTGTSLAASYAASGASLSLAGAGSAGIGASDVDGLAPRIAVGDTLKIDNEFFYVLSGTTSENKTPNVKPYMNGTTAASHAASAAVYKFSPEPDIEWCAKRLAAWTYGQKDTPYQSRTVNAALGIVEIELTMPPDVRSRLNRFVRRKLAVISSN